MTKKYLHYSFLTLISYNTFGIEGILAVKPVSYGYELIANKLPEGFIRRNGQKYADLSNAMKCIADHLQPLKKDVCYFYDHTKKGFLSSNRYIIIKFLNSSKKNAFYYCFEWKKRSYNELQRLEKHAADYYKANRSSKIEFLYPYERKDKDKFGNIDNSPWTISINDQEHSLLWKDAIIEEKNATTQEKDSPANQFLVVKLEHKAKILKLLVDENNNVLAKNINGIIAYNTNEEQNK